MIGNYFHWNNIAVVMIVLGTCLCVWETVHRYYHMTTVFWRTRPRSIITAGLHIFVYFLAKVEAQTSVADAFGLPAKDFESTVQIYALLMYIPTYLLMIAIIIFGASLVSMGTMAWLVTKSQIIDFLQSLTDGLHLNYRWLQNRVKFATPLEKGLETLGLATISSLLFMIAGTLFLEVRHSEWLMHLIAYKVDYHQIRQFPGIDPNSKVILHGEGLISCATIEGNNVKIEVKKLEPLSTTAQ